MNRRITVCLSILPVLVLAQAVRATRVERPTKPVDPKHCVTSECHASVKNYPSLHGPVNVDDCDACHKLVDAKTHTFEMTREKAALCTYCHEFDTTQYKILHKPVKEGECLGCHNPHGGRNASLTRGATSAELCNTCHENEMANKKHLHTPVAKGECGSCHPSHGSQYPNLLVAKSNDLCLSCHKKLRSKLANAKFRHDAVDIGCSMCHKPHGSNSPENLVSSDRDLCVSCHDDIVKEASGARYKHTPVSSDRACLTCHTPHAGDYAALMKDVPSQVCMDCHKDSVKAEKNRIVPAVTELRDPKLVKHGPIKEGSCSGCHLPHGGDRSLLLAKNYSEDFYQVFRPENYDLCFSCHDKTLVTEQRTTKASAFRNGDENLHFIHTNKANRGRSCSVCHEPHASRNLRNIRDSVQYGKWQLPIGWQKTPTGGTCVSGCHATYQYDREKAVPLPTTRPATPSRLAASPSPVPATRPAR